MFAVEVVLVFMAVGVCYILCCVWGVGDAECGYPSMVRRQYIDGNNNTYLLHLFGIDADSLQLPGYRLFIAEVD